MSWCNYFCGKITMTTHHAKKDINRSMLVKVNPINTKNRPRLRQNGTQKHFLRYFVSGAGRLPLE